MRRGRILNAFAFAVAFAGAAIACAATPPAEAAPSASRCVHLGLEPIPVTIRAGAGYVRETGVPEYEVHWTGKPLPSSCNARITMATEVTVWFPHLRFPFSKGYLLPWREFWNGRREVHDGRWLEDDTALFTGLECPYKARAKLRYEVTGPHGSVLGRRVVPVPVELLPCPARIRSKESPRVR